LLALLGEKARGGNGRAIELLLRERLPAKPPEESATPPVVDPAGDPFAEVDELAAKRRAKTSH
jgi:hypothetical protein